MSTMNFQTNFEPVMKVLYPAEVIKNETYRKNPLFALMPKDETFTGESSKEPLMIADSQNRSNLFSSANAYNTTPVYNAFLLTRVQNYSMASISNETLLASQGNESAFIEGLKAATDSALHSLARSMAVQMYRKSTGTVARISATATLNSSTVPVQLANPSDITNLEYGMKLGFSATDGGAAESGTAFVVQINRSTGTFLCSATPGGAAAALTSLVGTIAVNDYIYANAGDVNLALSGLQDWLPGSAVTSTPFFGVNRSSDITRLAGVNYDGSSQAIDEALQGGASYIAREGGSSDHCFVNHLDYLNLSKALGSKSQYVQSVTEMVNETNVNVGFNGLAINGPAGVIKVIPDQNCPVGKAFMLELRTWKLKSLGAAVNLFNGDSLTILRDPSADNLLLRCFSYAQVSCRAPGWNGIITLPS